MNFNKYADSTILILGGGTSTLDVKWENLEYDYLWTCNEFYLETRLLKQNIDLYLLSHTVDLNNLTLLQKLFHSTTDVIYEPLHYRGKQNTSEFKNFLEAVKVSVSPVELPNVPRQKSVGGLSGAAFRLILTALLSKPKNVYFAGFDGFNKDFTNVHAFTKHPGLKPTDTRRTFEGTEESYYNIFTEAYKWFLNFDNYLVLQNLGEGFNYNIGTPVSRKYFPLRQEIYEKTR